MLNSQTTRLQRTIFGLLLIFSLSAAQKSYAQMDEQRFKIELRIEAGNKTAKTLLNSSSISFSRQEAYASLDSTKTQKTSVGTNTVPQIPREIYLSADAASVSKEAMEILAQHKGTLKGSIIVTDAYNQSQVKTIQFAEALLSGYSDQVSSYGYNGKPGSVAFSFVCKELVVDGVKLTP
ncbi:hypothetical protein [Sphingobacterium paludis]|uniref:Uncharacterized protein n=1 Tax=Sphingobacterium paludis TaxID=1476465 RepID=A0A4R7CWT8_9SPHI|nr:hypothetical protein [Sphingobacterium paludis]TDS12322.1 hypothetical protein B0I21_106180 [Sphingobacterium paludis]